MTLDQALQRHFGYNAFRPLQRDIIAATRGAQDVLALLPTGGGKSLCYQLPAILEASLTLVVSPLIALMKDQVDALTARGIESTFLNSSLEPSLLARRMRELDAGKYRLLYVSPERAVVASFLNRLDRWRLGRIAVDEAHCVSEWGHDFRPDYRQLSQLRARYQSAPILALTATATPQVRKDIVRFLGLREPRCFIASFNRPNLEYQVFEKRHALSQLLDWCKQRKGQSGIVYAQSRKSAEELAAALSAAGIAASPYHAGLSREQRVRNQEGFVRDEIHVICATIAFGMGIDKANVRYVVHYDVPKSIEGYYQETGRAGRDGLPSECALFFSFSDASKQRRFIADLTDPDERERATRLLRKMLDFASTGRCRRAYILRYFGERGAAECHNCDNCLRPSKRINATVHAQKVLSCIYRMRSQSGISSGAHHLVDVLRGNLTEKVRDRKHDGLSTFGIGKEWQKREWLALISELLAEGWLEEEGSYRTLLVTDEGRRALKKCLAFSLPTPRYVAKENTISNSSATAGERPKYDQRLFEELRRLRKNVAASEDVPVYVIFHDRVLRELASKRPTTLEEFQRIHGIGAVKVERYGRRFTQAILSFAKRQT